MLFSLPKLHYVIPLFIYSRLSFIHLFRSLFHCSSPFFMLISNFDDDFVASVIHFNSCYCISSVIVVVLSRALLFFFTLDCERFW